MEQKNNKEEQETFFDELWLRAYYTALNRTLDEKRKKLESSGEIVHTFKPSEYINKEKEKILIQSYGEKTHRLNDCKKND